MTNTTTITTTTVFVNGHAHRFIPFYALPGELPVRLPAQVNARVSSHGVGIQPGVIVLRKLNNGASVVQTGFRVLDEKLFGGTQPDDFIDVSIKGLEQIVL